MIDFLERARKRDFFDSTIPETLSSDILYTIRNFNTFEILTVIKCLVLESLQRGRKFDSLYRTPCKNRSFPVVSVDNFFFPEPLQPLIQYDSLQIFATIKYSVSNPSQLWWCQKLLDRRAVKAVFPDLLESVREPDVPQTSAVIKRRVPDALESFGEEYSRKITAVSKRTLSYCLQFAPLLECNLL